MTLKTAGSGMMDMSQLKKGEVVRGKIKRLEAFGAFVQLDNSNLSGLAHISEISDDFVKNLQDVLQVGQGLCTLAFGADRLPSSIHHLWRLSCSQNLFG